MTEVPMIHRTIAKYLAREFGGDPKVLTQNFDDGVCINVFVARGAPNPSQTSYSTIGLSDRMLSIGGESYGFGIELCGGVAENGDGFELMLGDIGYEIVSGNWIGALHTVFPGAIVPYFPDSPMKHLLLAHPFSWAEDFGLLETPERKIIWLQFVPITDEEYQFALANGADALEERLETCRARVFDLFRASVI